MLIFLLQSVWMYITELAGKDLELDIILKFLSYVSPRLVVLVLPLAILLSSIMVFGQLSENYEFAAMKSTGLSLQRIMRSLIYFTLFLGIIVFFFSNNVVTAAEFSFINLRKNISKVKPTMAIAEGQFSEIGDFNIKVEEKYGNRGQYLTDVIVHQKKNTPGNYTVIKSKTGEITNESANHGGFNLIVSAGELSSLDNTTQIIDGEATHTTFGNNQRIWHIKWAAPSNNHQDVTFTAHGNSVNGDGSNLGDEWNKVVIISAGVPNAVTPGDNKQTNVFVIALIIMGIGALAATRVSKWN